MRTARGLGLCLALALGGCASLDPFAPPASSPPVPSSPPPPDPRPIPPPPPPRPAPMPAPSLRLDPASLTGLDGDQVQNLLGPPAQRDTQQLGQVWHWRKNGCGLSVALYPDAKDGTLRVAASEVSGTRDAAACAGSLRRTPGGRDGG